MHMTIPSLRLLSALALAVLTLPVHAQPGPSPLEVGKINNVSAGPDNGALDCTAGCWWLAMRHSTVEQAITNTLTRVPGGLASAPSPKRTPDSAPEPMGCYPVNIDGHGSDGFMTFGSGQTGNQDYKTNVIMNWNQTFWEPQFRRLAGKCIPDLWLFSCHTGAGEEGADLLYAIAKIIGKPVHARTGLTYCGSKCVTFEPGSVWQTATPTYRPPAIPPPSMISYRRSRTAIATLEVDKTATEVPLDAVEEVILSRAFLGKATIEVKFEAKRAAALADQLLYSDPFTPPGQPLSHITGEVTLRLMIAKTLRARAFEIHSDRLLRDKESGLFYYLGPDAIALLKQLHG